MDISSTIALCAASFLACSNGSGIAAAPELATEIPQTAARNHERGIASRLKRSSNGGYQVSAQSCSAYAWYRKCKTESPAQYCCDTIRYDDRAARAIDPATAAHSMRAFEIFRVNWRVLFAALTILLSAPGPSMASSQSQCMNHCAYYASRFYVKELARTSTEVVQERLLHIGGTRENSEDLRRARFRETYSPPRNW